ncbi:hypothetical protein JCM10207_006927 [Rhodosporidiobolus poonsookiae]
MADQAPHFNTLKMEPLLPVALQTNLQQLELAAARHDERVVEAVSALVQAVKRKVHGQTWGFLVLQDFSIATGPTSFQHALVERAIQLRFEVDAGRATAAGVDEGVRTWNDIASAMMPAPPAHSPRPPLPTDNMSSHGKLAYACSMVHEAYHRKYPGQDNTRLGHAAAQLTEGVLGKADHHAADKLASTFDFSAHNAPSYLAVVDRALYEVAKQVYKGEHTPQSLHAAEQNIKAIIDRGLRDHATFQSIPQQPPFHMNSLSRFSPQSRRAAPRVSSACW